MSSNLSVPPTAIARRYVRYVTGFGVGVAIGVAPFLGKIKLPGFSALLELFPLQLQKVLVPLSAFLMGLVVVAIQFYAREKIVRSSLRRWFKWVFVTILTGLVTFLVLYNLFVRIVTTENSSAAVVVTDTRLKSCQCAEETDEECIRNLSLAPEALATCWGGPALHVRELLLMLTYLLLTGGFGALIGLLMLQEEAKRAAKRSPPPRSQRKASASPRAAPPPTPPGTLPPAGPSP